MILINTQLTKEDLLTNIPQWGIMNMLLDTPLGYKEKRRLIWLNVQIHIANALTVHAETIVLALRTNVIVRLSAMNLLKNRILF